MRRSTYDLLPIELQAKVDDLIKKSHFGNFTELVDQVNKMILESGYEISFSRTSLYNRAKNLEKVIEQIKYSQEAAKIVMDCYPDDDLKLSQATGKFIQDKLFRLAMDNEDLSPDELAKIAKALSDVAKSTVSERKYLDDRLAKIEKQTKAIDSQVKEGKLSFEDAFKKITTEVYGL
jgi:hypothetical protein